MTKHRTQGLLAVAALLLLATGLGATDLWAPDEPRYGRIADELRSFEHGASGLLLLHLNGEPYTQKPPLYFWLAALAGAARGGVDEIAARLPPAVAGIACVLLTLQLGRRLLPSPAASAWGAAILLTTFRFAHQARRAQLDVLLCLFELVAMLAFVRIEQGRGRATHNVALLHGALGLAVLTKGPVGLLPLLVAAVFLARDGRLRQMKSLLPPWGLALSLGPGLLWISAAIALAPAGFAEEAVIDNVLGRFFAGTDHIRPLYYYLYQLPLDFLPWSLAWPVFALASWRSTGLRRSQPGGRLLWTWIAVHFVVFSLSTGKRGLYLLPAFPAIALLTGAALETWLTRRARPRDRDRGALVIAASLGLLGVANTLAGGLRVWPWSAIALPVGLGLALCAIAALLAVTSRFAERARTKTAIGIGLLVAFELAVFTLGFPAVNSEKSPRPVALEAMRHAEPGAPIAVFEQKALTGGIAHYSGRRVVLLNGEEELHEFVAQGGHTIVIRQSRFERLAVREGFEQRASLRNGRRELLIVVPREAEARTRGAPTSVRGRWEEQPEPAVAQSGVYPTGL